MGTCFLTGSHCADNTFSLSDEENFHCAEIECYEVISSDFRGGSLGMTSDS